MKVHHSGLFGMCISIELETEEERRQALNARKQHYNSIIKAIERNLNETTKEKENNEKTLENHIRVGFKQS